MTANSDLFRSAIVNIYMKIRVGTLSLSLSVSVSVSVWALALCSSTIPIMAPAIEAKVKSSIGFTRKKKKKDDSNPLIIMII